jgi:hypothetical protein
MNRQSTNLKMDEDNSEEADPANEVVGNLIDNLFGLATLSGVDPARIDSYQNDFQNQAGVLEVME